MESENCAFISAYCGRRTPIGIPPRSPPVAPQCGQSLPTNYVSTSVFDAAAAMQRLVGLTSTDVSESLSMLASQASTWLPNPRPAPANATPRKRLERQPNLINSYPFPETWRPCARSVRPSEHSSAIGHAATGKPSPSRARAGKPWHGCLLI